ncbi:MAG: hypothetical protein N2Z23_05185, partial [Pyrinomonadaceae bacterium]|nr:hypothetical protein [Pyrinomonadaceae bacterium]
MEKKDLVVVLTIFGEPSTEEEYSRNKVIIIDRKVLTEKIRRKLREASFDFDDFLVFYLSEGICVFFIKEDFEIAFSEREGIMESTISKAWRGKEEKDIVKYVLKAIDDSIDDSNSPSSNFRFIISYLLCIKNRSCSGSMENLGVGEELARYRYLGTLIGTLYGLEEKGKKEKGRGKKEERRRFFLLETSSTLQEENFGRSYRSEQIFDLLLDIELAFHQSYHISENLLTKLKGKDKVVDSRFKKTKDELSREVWEKEKEFRLVDSRELEKINLKFSELRKSFAKLEMWLSLCENRWLVLKNKSEYLKRRVERFKELIELDSDCKEDRYIKEIEREEWSNTALVDLHLTNLKNFRDKVRQLIEILNIHFSEHR